MYKNNYWKIKNNALFFLLGCLLYFSPSKSFAIYCEVTDSSGATLKIDTHSGDNNAQMETRVISVYGSNTLDSSGNEVIVLEFDVRCKEAYGGAMYVEAALDGIHRPMPHGVYGSVSYNGYKHALNYDGRWANRESVNGTVRLEIIGPPGSFNGYTERLFVFTIADDWSRRWLNTVNFLVRNSNFNHPVKTCDVDQGEQTITLPDYDEKTDNRVPVSINVNCNHSTGLSFMLSGNTSMMDDSIYLNSATNGAAQNMGVRFYYNDNEIVNNSIIRVSDGTTNSNINLMAGYAKMPGAVTAGIVMAKAILTITYN